MAGCVHGMDPTWCYLCRVDGVGTDPQILWGIALDDDLTDLQADRGPMSADVADYLRFLSREMGLGFDPTFTQRQATLVIESFLLDPATPDQLQTLTHLGIGDTDGLSYAAARTRIRRTIALRGLRSA